MVIVAEHGGDKYLSATLAPILAMATSKLRKDSSSLPTSILSSKPTHRVYIDITSNCFHKGEPFGILRVELGYARELCTTGLAEPVVWRKSAHDFVKLPSRCLEDGSYRNASTLMAGIPAGTSELNPGSILILPSYVWFDHPDFFSDITNLARNKRLELIPFIYDTTWNEFQYLFTPEIANKYSSGVLAMLKAVDRIITISHNSRKDIESFCKANLMTMPGAIVCHLADSHTRSGASDPADKINLTTDPGFLLCVSTIAGHKNHKLLLALWRQMIRAYGAAQIPKLVCVGYPGEAAKEFENEITRDPVIRNHIVWLKNLPEAQLRWLYQNCIFTVYPSLYEGWGLPVSESLAHGKICVASNAASIPEIAPTFTDMLHPLDFPAWYSKLTNYIFDSDLRRKREAQIAGYRPVSWQESALSLYSRLAGAKDCTSVTAADCVDFGIIRPALANPRIFEFGWGGIKDGVLCSSGQKARIILILAAGNQKRILKFSLRSRRNEIQMSMNGRLREVLRFRNEEWQERAILIPSIVPYKNGDRLLRIELAHDRGTSMELDIRKMELESAPDDSLQLDGILENVQKLHQALGAGLRSMAHENTDLASTLVSLENPAAIMLWCWRYGIGGDTRIGRHWLAIKRIVGEMGLQKAAGATREDYSVLADAVAGMREELRGLPKDTEEGQSAIISWLTDYGIAEYNLGELSNEPKFGHRAAK